MTERKKKLIEILNRDNEHIYKNLINDLHALKSRTVLVTGAKGFLGKTVISFLDYINKTKLQEAERVNIIAIDYEDFDICKPLDNFVKEDKIDYIINFAGIASPKKYLQKPIETLDVSYLGTKNVLDLARDRGTKSVLMFSSSEVYGTPDPGNIPTGEDYIGSVTTFGNRSCYDIGKNVLETLSYVYHEIHNTPVNVIRPFNLYGPLMNTDDGRIIANICKSMIKETEFSIYGDGRQTRTYCYVTDAIVFMLKVLLLDKFGEIYNIGSEEEELSAVEVTQYAYDLVRPKNSLYSITPHPSGYPDNEPQRRKPDISKVKTATGYIPEYKFEDGFMSCFSAFEDILSEVQC